MGVYTTQVKFISFLLLFLVAFVIALIICKGIKKVVPKTIVLVIWMLIVMVTWTLAKVRIHQMVYNFLNDVLKLNTPTYSNAIHEKYENEKFLEDLDVE